MKKIAFFAFAALCAAAAQAVTLNWSTGAGETVVDKPVVPSVSSGQLCGSTSFAVMLTFNTANITTQIDEIVRYGQWDGGNTYLTAYSGNKDLGYRGTFGYSAGAQVIGNKASMQYLFTMTYENVGTQINVKGYIDGICIYDGKTSTNMNGLSVWVTANDVYTIDGTAAYSGVLTQEQITWMSNNGTAIVPEPTALALLALGVAGLALKRKVA